MLENVHTAAQRKYSFFCRNRTSALYELFFSLVDEDGDGNWWEHEGLYTHSFVACVPFPGKKNERKVSGGMRSSSKQPHGLVRYAYKQNIIEEGRRDGKPHGLRVVCTQMGHVWIRLWRRGDRLAQIVLNGDMSVQSTIDDGGLKMLKDHLPAVLQCFV